MGAANKVSGNKIPGKKVLKKINPRKRKTQNCESCIFTFQRTFFPRTFLHKIILEPEKVLENNVSNWQDFFPGDFLIKRTFSPGLFPETFFPRTFLAVTVQMCTAVVNVNKKCHGGTMLFCFPESPKKYSLEDEDFFFSTPRILPEKSYWKCVSCKGRAIPSGDIILQVTVKKVLGKKVSGKKIYTFLYVSALQIKRGQGSVSLK